MDESVAIFIKIVLGLIGFVAVIAIGWLTLFVGGGLFVYIVPLALTIGGIALFAKGGGIGAFGLFLLIPGVLLSIKAYLKCRKCGFGLKIFWICDSFGGGDNFGTRCLRCKDLRGWWG